MAVMQEGARRGHAARMPPEDGVSVSQTKRRSHWHAQAPAEAAE